MSWSVVFLLLLHLSLAQTFSFSLSLSKLYFLPLRDPLPKARLTVTRARRCARWRNRARRYRADWARELPKARSTVTRAYWCVHTGEIGPAGAELAGFSLVQGKAPLLARWPQVRKMGILCVALPSSSHFHHCFWVPIGSSRPLCQNDTICSRRKCPDHWHVFRVKMKILRVDSSQMEPYFEVSISNSYS